MKSTFVLVGIAAVVSACGAPPPTTPAAPDKPRPTTKAAAPAPVRDEAAVRRDAEEILSSGDAIEPAKIKQLSVLYDESSAAVDEAIGQLLLSESLVEQLRGAALYDDLGKKPSKAEVLRRCEATRGDYHSFTSAEDIPYLRSWIEPGNEKQAWPAMQAIMAIGGTEAIDAVVDHMDNFEGQEREQLRTFLASATPDNASQCARVEAVLYRTRPGDDYEPPFLDRAAEPEVAACHVEFLGALPPGERFTAIGGILRKLGKPGAEVVREFVIGIDEEMALAALFADPRRLAKQSGSPAPKPSPQQARFRKELKGPLKQFASYMDAWVDVKTTIMVWDAASEASGARALQRAMQVFAAGGTPSHVPQMNKKALALAVVAANKVRQKIGIARWKAKAIRDEKLRKKALATLDNTIAKYDFVEKP